jgi:uncharacterized protein involved in oxidation of intracellular sulfur
MKSWLIILNDGPYGNERSYNGLRLALALLKQAKSSVRVFLMGDAVTCAMKGQVTPQGYYNVERIISSVVKRGAVAT